MHPVFHVSLLKPHMDNGTRQPPPPILVDEEPYYMMESLVDHQDISVCGGHCKTHREYLVKWEGYDSHHNTREPEESLCQSGPLSEAINVYKCSLEATKRKQEAAQLRRSVCLRK